MDPARKTNCSEEFTSITPYNLKIITSFPFLVKVSILNTSETLYDNPECLNDIKLSKSLIHLNNIQQAICSLTNLG